MRASSHQSIDRPQFPFPTKYPWPAARRFARGRLEVVAPGDREPIALSRSREQVTRPTSRVLRISYTVRRGLARHAVVDGVGDGLLGDLDAGVAAVEDLGDTVITVYGAYHVIGSVGGVYS